MPSRKTYAILGTAFALVISSSSLAGEPEMEFQEMVDAYNSKLKPLTIEANLAHWQANLTGTDQDYQSLKESRKALADLHSNREVFAKLVAFKKSNLIADPILRRKLQVMYHSFLPRQADQELTQRIIELEADVSQIFNTHRSLVDGKKVTENEVRKILKETSDTELARKAWSGYMALGRKVEAKLKELAKLRNQVADKLGFKNYFSLKMELQEFDEKELFKIFEELDALTQQPFAQLKKKIDAHMMKRFGLQAHQLRPWHTGDLFFQEAPDLVKADLDDLFQSHDIIALSSAHYASLGLKVDDILARSDLYEKPGKNPHAFCSDIDRHQDVRILCNIKNNSQWMDTIHHELGHAVYDKYIGQDLPFILHTAAHSLTTEGVALLLGSLTKNEEFLHQVVKVSDSDAARYAAGVSRNLQMEKLIFCRWTQVMLHFEKGMYNNPDQDLNQLWWGLKKKYQLLNPPDDMSGADYGAKMHIVSYPIYYHNYMMGDLFSAQVHYYIANNILGIDDPHKTCFFGNQKAGQYLKEKVFAPGNLYHWNELTKRATGEPLTAKYFARLYVDPRP